MILFSLLLITFPCFLLFFVCCYCRWIINFNLSCSLYYWHTMTRLIVRQKIFACLKMLKIWNVKKFLNSRDKSETSEMCGSENDCPLISVCFNEIFFIGLSDDDDFDGRLLLACCHSTINNVLSCLPVDAHHFIPLILTRLICVKFIDQQT